MEVLSRGLTSLTIAVFAFITMETAQGAISASNSGYNDADSIGYDSIINDLNREASRPSPSLRARGATSVPSALDSLILHFGVGLANLMQAVEFDGGHQAFLDQRGVQVTGGIDLFSVNWMIEGTYRNFGESSSGPTFVTLQEWELKVINRNRFTRMIGYRAGGGLSARYMGVRGRFGAADYTTPSGLLNLGLDAFANDHISFGLDLTGRSAMIAETPDKNSVDLTLRIDTHF